MSNSVYFSGSFVTCVAPRILLIMRYYQSFINHIIFTSSISHTIDLRKLPTPGKGLGQSDAWEALYSQSNK